MAEKDDINEKLRHAVAAGKLAKVLELLKNGAHPDGNGGAPLINAAFYGHEHIVHVLLRAGADVTLMDEDGTAEDHARRKKHLDAANYLQYWREMKRPDLVSFSRSIGNRVLEEIFDFSARERISLIRLCEYGKVEAVTHTGFSALEDKSRLRKAFNEHVRRGGQTKESDIFGVGFDKPKINPSP